CETHRQRSTGGCNECANGGPQQHAPPQQQYAQPGYPQQQQYAQPGYPQQQQYAQPGYPQQQQYAQPGYPQQQQQQQYAQQPGYGAPAGYPPQGGGAVEGCEICGAVDAPSFVCYGCTRCVCESHRERT